MVNLKHAVQDRGFTVAHIKTDSIKIPNATPEIVKFVMDYGKETDTHFEHEATYDRMCLVNDAVYICKYAALERCYELYGKEYVESEKDICKENKKHPLTWSATGTQFQVPYVFKKLFSREPIEFDDLCETKSVSTALYLDMNEGLPEDAHNYKFVGRVGAVLPYQSRMRRRVAPAQDGQRIFRSNGVEGGVPPGWSPKKSKKLGKERMWTGLTTIV